MGRANRVMVSELELALDAANVSVIEFTALSVVASRPGLSNARLARRSMVNPQTMHNALTSLIGRGLVERRAVARALEAHITPEGEALLAELEPRRRAAEDRFLSVLEPSEREVFGKLLRKVGRVDR